MLSLQATTTVFDLERFVSGLRLGPVQSAWMRRALFGLGGLAAILAMVDFAYCDHDAVTAVATIAVAVAGALAVEISPIWRTDEGSLRNRVMPCDRDFVVSCLAVTVAGIAGFAVTSLLLRDLSVPGWNSLLVTAALFLAGATCAVMGEWVGPVVCWHLGHRGALAAGLLVILDGGAGGLASDLSLAIAPLLAMFAAFGFGFGILRSVGRIQAIGRRRSLYRGVGPGVFQIVSPFISVVGQLANPTGLADFRFELRIAIALVIASLLVVLAWPGGRQPTWRGFAEVNPRPAYRYPGRWHWCSRRSNRAGTPPDQSPQDLEDPRETTPLPP